MDINVIQETVFRYLVKFLQEQCSISSHLPAAGRGVAEEVVDHVELVLLHHYETLLSGLPPVHVWRPLDEKRVEMVHPGARKEQQS